MESASGDGAAAGCAQAGAGSGRGDAEPVDGALSPEMAGLRKGGRPETPQTPIHFCRTRGMACMPPNGAPVGWPRSPSVPSNLGSRYFLGLRDARVWWRRPHHALWCFCGVPDTGYLCPKPQHGANARPFRALPIPSPSPFRHAPTPCWQEPISSGQRTGCRLCDSEGACAPAVRALVFGLSFCGNQCGHCLLCQVTQHHHRNVSPALSHGTLSCLHAPMLPVLPMPPHPPCPSSLHRVPQRCRACVKPCPSWGLACGPWRLSATTRRSGPRSCAVQSWVSLCGVRVGCPS
jgi:hypothetical protein